MGATPGNRIASLDGLRAVSIGLVVLAHLAGTRNFLGRASILGPVGDIGNLGVRVFFVISGYLITTLLLEELAKHGRISLTTFYLRRTLRIFPAFYVFVIVVAGLDRIGVISLTRLDLLHAITYTSNYYPERSWYFGHLWSLSVEEQFYLCWPLAMVLLGPRGALAGAAGVIFCAPLARLGTWYLLSSHRQGMGEEFQTIADALATGCLLAGAREWTWRRQGYKRFLLSRWFVLVPVLVWSINRQPFVIPRWLIGETLINIGIALIIDRVIRVPDDLVGRFLNWRPVVWVGVLSYSLYLWQQLFLNRSSTSMVTSFPWNLALALGAATLSYYLVEKPFLRLRRYLEFRWQRVRTVGVTA